MASNVFPSKKSSYGPSNVTSQFLCRNPACCPYKPCDLGHYRNYTPGTSSRLTVCRYQENCSDALCLYYHPHRKTKPVCTNWWNCSSYWCRYSHAHSLRPPVCKKGSTCSTQGCCRIHPPSNTCNYSTAKWTVLTQLSHLVEQFLDFSDCRKSVSQVCRAMNNAFSTNSTRLTRAYKFRNKFLPLRCLHFGDFELFVPSDFSCIFWADHSQSAIISSLPNYFSFLTKSLSVKNITELERTFVASVPFNSWVVVENNDKQIVLEYPVGVDLSWQTRTTLYSLTTIDVCSPDGIWHTCKIIDVDTSHIVVEYPWWFTNDGHVFTSGLDYPSCQLAPAGSQAYNWRLLVGVGSSVRYKSHGLVTTVLINHAEPGLYQGLSREGAYVLIPEDLVDTTSEQFGPSMSRYTLSPAQLSLPRLNMTDLSKKTVVTFHRDTRYDTPEIQVVEKNT